VDRLWFAFAAAIGNRRSVRDPNAMAIINRLHTEIDLADRTLKVTIVFHERVSQPSAARPDGAVWDPRERQSYGPGETQSVPDNGWRSKVDSGRAHCRADTMATRGHEMSTRHGRLARRKRETAGHP
jgi:hypothetical protein